MARKPRLTDTITGAVKAMADASAPLPQCPPEVSLRDKDLPFWERIVRARARDEWDGPEIVAGVQLARCQADIESEQTELDFEGSVITNDRGTKVANPRFAILEQLSRRQMALMRSLALNATATTRAADLQKKRGPEKAARKAREEIEAEGDLLA